MNRRHLVISFLLLTSFCAGMPLARSAPMDIQEQELLSTAQQAFNDGFADVAIRYLEDFLIKYPQSLKLNTAKLLLGQSYFLRGQYPKALGFFQDLKDLPDNKDAILFWLGETYLKMQDYDRAGANYQAVISNYPQSSYVAQSYYSMAWGYFEQKNFVKARAEFEQLVKLFPRHQFSEDAMLKIAECAYNDGKFEDALKLFQSYLSQYPQSPHLCTVNFDIAENLYYLERFDEALGFYQKVNESSCEDSLKLSGDMGALWSEIKLKKFGEAENLYKTTAEFVRAKGMPQDDLALVRANLAFEEGKYIEAVPLFTEFIRKYPQSTRIPEAYLARANAYFVLKQYDEAIVDYQHIAQKSDGDMFQKAYFGLGWTQLKLGHLADAIKQFEVVRDSSTDPTVKANALIQIADAYQDNGRLDEAVAAYEQVLKSDEDYAMADYARYRQAIALLKGEKIDLALAAFERLRADFPNSRYLEDIDYYRGVAAFKKNSWKIAVTTMDRFLKNLLRPSEFTPEANYILALSYLNLKQSEDALRVFQKILRLYPNDISVAKNAEVGIAKCQFELGQVKEAVKRFKLIAYKYPRSEAEEEALLWLAQYYLRNAQYAMAVDFYQALVDRFPNNVQIDQVHYELGQAYEVQSQIDQALEQYKMISVKNPTLMAKAKLAIAGILSKEMDPQRAVSAYENIIVSNPDFAGDAYLRLGQLYRNEQNYEKEVEVYQRALKVKDEKGVINKAQVQFNLADTFELMSRTEEAIEQYLNIPHLYPQELAWVVKAYLRVAKIYEEGKDWEGAQVIYQKIIQLNTEELKFAQERLDWIKNNVGVKKSR